MLAHRGCKACHGTRRERSALNARRQVRAGTARRQGTGQGSAQNIGPPIRCASRDISPTAGARWVKWDADKNQLKETAWEWVKFLRDSKHFPAGGVPLEPNTPSLAAFQAWIGKAAA